MDYKTLLVKYISLIANYEGTTHIDNRYSELDGFTKEEWAELNILADNMVYAMTPDAEFEIIELKQIENGIQIPLQHS